MCLLVHNLCYYNSWSKLGIALRGAHALCWCSNKGLHDGRDCNKPVCGYYFCLCICVFYFVWMFYLGCNFISSSVISVFYSTVVFPVFAGEEDIKISVKHQLEHGINSWQTSRNTCCDRNVMQNCKPIIAGNVKHWGLFSFCAKNDSNFRGFIGITAAASIWLKRDHKILLQSQLCAVKLNHCCMLINKFYVHDVFQFMNFPPLHNKLQRLRNSPENRASLLYKFVCSDAALIRANMRQKYKAACLWLDLILNYNH